MKRLLQGRGWFLVVMVLGTLILSMFFIFPVEVRANGPTTAEKIGNLEEKIAELEASQEELEASQEEANENIAKLEKGLEKLKTEIDSLRHTPTWLLLVGIVVIVVVLILIIDTLFWRRKRVLRKEN